MADIEGAEAGIFLHDKEALARCRLMIIELHEIQYEGRRLSIQDQLQLASESGFVCRNHHRAVYVLENQASPQEK